MCDELDSKLEFFCGPILYLANYPQANKRQEILKWLVSTDPSSFHNSTLALREDTTGKWLQKSLEYSAWKNGETSLIWFYGIPGAGKPVLFSYIVEDIKTYCETQPDRQSAYVYYYCHFGRNQDESTHLLRWAISQLARQTVYLPPEISAMFEAGQQPGLHLMVKSFLGLCSRFRRVHLLVDGLDESVQRANLTHILLSMHRNQPNNINILIMSREEADVKEALRDTCQAVSLANPFVHEDSDIYSG